MNTAEQFERAARRHPDALAVVCESGSVTYQRLHDRSSQFANALAAMGIEPGARVATWLENSVACVEIDFALAKAGLVRVPLNPRCTIREACVILTDVEPDALLLGAGFAEHARDLQGAAPTLRHTIVVGDAHPAALPAGALAYEDLIARAIASHPRCPADDETLHSIFYTSGSSGRPKGCMHTHRGIFQVACNVLLEIGPAAPGEKLLLLQPLSHGAAYFVLPYLMRGCTVVVMPRFDASRALTLMHDMAIETVRLVPTMLQRMLRAPEIETLVFPKLRQILYAGSPVPGEVLREAIDRFGPRLCQQYGQSEAPSTLALLERADHTLENLERGVLGTAGYPWPTVELKVVDRDDRALPDGTAGEVIARAPHCMAGYWKQPELSARTLRGGWLRTNDLGVIESDGRLRLLGRMDEMIVSGGYNIAPREVEDVLHRHPAVIEAAVVAEPDPEWGQAVVAYVVVSDPALEADALIAFARPLLGYKRPRRIHLRSELPKTPNGKIEKSALRPVATASCGP